jgi:hypothetical protein
MTDEKAEPLPYFDKDGDIVIPFASNKKYHYWNGGQLLSETIEEIKALFGEPPAPIVDPESARKRQALIDQYQVWGKEALALRALDPKGKKKPAKGKMSP